MLKHIEQLLGALTIALLGAGAVIWLQRAQYDTAETHTVAPWRFDKADTVAILLVSRTCSACTDDAFVSAVRHAVAIAANDTAPTIRYTAAALDWHVQPALEYLRRLGNFSEVSAGNQWLNSVALELVWLDTVPIPIVPQLILIERVVRDDRAREAILIDQNRILGRHLGAPDITEWMRSRVQARQ